MSAILVRSPVLAAATVWVVVIQLLEVAAWAYLRLYTEASASAALLGSIVVTMTGIGGCVWRLNLNYLTGQERRATTIVFIVVLGNLAAELAFFARPYAQSSADDFAFGIFVIGGAIASALIAATIFVYEEMVVWGHKATLRFFMINTFFTCSALMPLLCVYEVWQAPVAAGGIQLFVWALLVYTREQHTQWAFGYN